MKFERLDKITKLNISQNFSSIEEAGLLFESSW